MIEEKITAFGERLRDVFGEDLAQAGWKLQKFGRVGTDDNPLDQGYFIFSKNDDSGEAVFNYDLRTSLTAIQLKLIAGGVEERYGQQAMNALFSRDPGKTVNSNDDTLSKLAEKEEALFKRILHYFNLKAPENIYE
ncbi:MAG: hypothetical protein A2Y33_00335 [Spirochaetes bacterium GWF1_51_8]|nr:MAG: hypothetical protein A2Y33_00335 [Spirochaetes bacterium GWF1_51_8]